MTVDPSRSSERAISPIRSDDRRKGDETRHDESSLENDESTAVDEEGTWMVSRAV